MWAQPCGPVEKVVVSVFAQHIGSSLLEGEASIFSKIIHFRCINDPVQGVPTNDTRPLCSLRPSDRPPRKLRPKCSIEGHLKVAPAPVNTAWAPPALRFVHSTLTRIRIRVDMPWGCDEVCYVGNDDNYGACSMSK